MTNAAKRELRAHFASLRDGMTAAQRATETREICACILQSELYDKADSVLLYAALGSEIDLSEVAQDAWAKGKVVAYPRCMDREGRMAFFTVQGPERLTDGAFSIKEPDADCLPWQPTAHALCIVPALAVDANGYRIGYGKGYYDRFLATFTGTSVCAVFSIGKTESLPCGEYDLPVQYIIDREGETCVDAQDWQDNQPQNIINDDDYASLQDTLLIDEDYGAQTDEADSADDGYEPRPYEDGQADVRSQRFLYRWQKIPVLGKLPFDPVLLLVLGNFVLLLLSRVIDALLIDRDNEYLVVVLLQVMIFIIPGYLFLRFRGKEYVKRMRLRAPKLDHIFLMAGAAGALITGCFLLSVLMGNLSEGQSFVLYDTFTSRHDGSIAGVLYLVMAYAILPAFCEEVIFRSVLCAEFEGRGVICAVTVSSVLFSMLHFNLLAMPVYLFAGVILALTLYTTRSVFCAIIVHFLYNLFCLFGQSGFADFYVTQSATTLFLILMIAALLLCLAIFFGESSRLYRAYAGQGARDDYKPAQKLSGGEIARNIALAFASPGAILCVALYLAVCIFR